MTDADLTDHFAKRAARLHGRLMFERLTLRMIITAIERGQPERAAQMAKLCRERMSAEIDRTEAERDTLISTSGQVVEAVVIELRRGTRALALQAAE